MPTGGGPQLDVLTMERKHELRARNDERRPGQNRQLRPWRTEGLPQEQPPNRRRRWMLWAVWLLGYVIFFGILTVQDGGGESILYEFKARSPARTFLKYSRAETASRAGSSKPRLFRGNPLLPGSRASLRNRAPTRNSQPSGLPSRPTTAWRTGREPRDCARDADRPAARCLEEPLDFRSSVFVVDRLLRWMFKRRRRSVGRGLFGGGARKPVDPETVRVTFDDVAGIDEVEAAINEIVDFLKDPAKYQRLDARAPKGVLLFRAAGNR